MKEEAVFTSYLLSNQKPKVKRNKRLRKICPSAAKVSMSVLEDIFSLYGFKDNFDFLPAFVAFYIAVFTTASLPPS